MQLLRKIRLPHEIFLNKNSTDIKQKAREKKKGNVPKNKTDNVKSIFVLLNKLSYGVHFAYE